MGKRQDDKIRDRFGWPVSAWAQAAGISRASVYNLLADGKLDSVKFGARRLITTHPRDFLAGLAAQKAQAA